MGIQIVTICGSIRPGNYTSMALELVNDEFRLMDYIHGAVCPKVVLEAMMREQAA